MAFHLSADWSVLLPLAMSDPRLTTTPLPLPEHFSQAQKSFSLKKRLPFSSSSPFSLSLTPPPLLSHSLPPRPPPKWVPSVSRVFPQRPPSPWTPLSHSLSQTPPSPSLYDPSRPQSYFNQCFTNLGLLGRGSFGEVYKVSDTVYTFRTVNGEGTGRGESAELISPLWFIFWS